MRRGARFPGANTAYVPRPKPASPGPPVLINPGTEVSRVGTFDELALEAELVSSFAATGVPAGMSFNTITGVFTGTPTTIETVTTKVTATGPGGSTSTTWEWRVEPALVPPPEPEPELEPITTSLFAADVFAALEPMTEDPESEAVILALSDVVGEMFLQVEEAIRAREGYDAQTQTFNIDRTPAFLVPFVGKAAGVTVTVGIATDAQRQQVREGRAWHRGKLDQITAEIQRTLTGTKKVRYTSISAWQIEVFTEPAETPNPAATEAAGRGAKPGGIVMTFGLSTVPTIDQGTRTIDASAGKIDSAILANIT